MPNLYDAAASCRDAGLSIFPTSDKLPAFELLPQTYDTALGRTKGTWAPYQKRQPTHEEVRIWYEKKGACEVAYVCGPASHGHHDGAGLFVIDVDYKPIIPAFTTACGTALREVALSRTRSGNLHMLMFCDKADELHSKKLACRPNPEYISRAMTPGVSSFLCDIETRGRGGYACGWPTAGYAFEQYDPMHIPYADMDSVVYPLLQAALGFNQVRQEPSFRIASETRTGSDPNLIRTMIREFRDKHPVTDMLRAYGYTRVGTGRWKRPGGKSGSLLVSDDDQIAVAFSSNDPLYQYPNATGNPGSHVHDAFGVYMIWEHGGDMRSALRAIARELGYTRRERDYSASRPALPAPAPKVVSFVAGGDTIFLVDDPSSAYLLELQGLAVLCIPPGTHEIGTWIPQILEHPYRYAWFHPGAPSGPSELLAMAADAKMLACPWAAAELMERVHGDIEAFVSEVVQYAEHAVVPMLGMQRKEVPGA